MDLRVMTFNLRFADYDPSAPHSWPRRRAAVAELLRGEAPHLLGTQEGLYRQLREVHEDLRTPEGGYDWIGMGREGGSRGEFMALFYDTRRLEPLEYEHFWIASDPYEVGAKWPGAGSPRMVTWARFRDTAADREFYAFNTHLDNASEEARLAGARLLVQQMHSAVEPLVPLDPALPRIVTGDFNTPPVRKPGSVYETLLTDGELSDTWTAAPSQARGPEHATWHDYAGPQAQGARIDWILTSPGFRTRSVAVNTFTLDGELPSDHYPVQAALDFAD